jgi:hypothetical protein
MLEIGNVTFVMIWRVLAYLSLVLGACRGFGAGERGDDADKAKQKSRNQKTEMSIC